MVFDIEANGLFRAQGSIAEADTLWCVGAKDLKTGEKFYWGADQKPGWQDHAVKFLGECDMTLAHNGIDFDYKFLEVHHGLVRCPRAWDTMIVAKYLWPADALAEPDFARMRRGTMPARLVKRHSLEAWGYRTGTHKVDYSGGFDAWRPAMATYLMTGDLDGPEALWKLSVDRLGWSEGSKAPLRTPEAVIAMEHDCAAIIREQELDGIKFDMPAAISLSRDLTNQQRRIEKQLVKVFGSWWQPEDGPETGTTAARTTRRALTEHPDITVPRVSEKTGKELKPYVGPPLEETCAGDPFVRITRVEYNPSSRDHLGQRLQAVFGWKPKKFGANKKPTVDESVLEEIACIPEDVRSLLLDYFVVTKTLGMVSKGSQAWIAASNRQSEVHHTRSRIHGSMDTIGAVTRRGTHKGPNLGQVPSVRKEKLKDGREVPLLGLKGRYGIECRALFTADDGWEQTGVDASSLELILLGHYLYPNDDGAFSARVCDPSRDPHKENAEIAGGITRSDAKTAIYLFVYGGSAYKLSLDPAIIVTEDMVPELLSYRGLPMLLKSLEKRFDAAFVLALDDMAKARIARARQIIVAFEQNIAGLKDLKQGVTAAAERGFLKAIDGSRLFVRKPHAALNALLQSAGAIACKMWMVLLHAKLCAAGLRRGVDYKQVLWVHDELQFTHRPGLGPTIKALAEEALVGVGEALGLRGRFRTDGKTGRNWAECH